MERVHLTSGDAVSIETIEQDAEPVRISLRLGHGEDAIRAELRAHEALLLARTLTKMVLDRTFYGALRLPGIG